MHNTVKTAYSMLSSFLFSLLPFSALLLILVCYFESFSYICRAIWMIITFLLAEKAFPKANMHHQSTQVHLMDALAVPYHKPSYIKTQILILTGICIPVMLLMTLSSCAGKSSLYPSAAFAFMDTLVYSALYLTPLFLSFLCSDETVSILMRIIAAVFAIGYVFPQYVPLYSFLSLILALASPVLFLLEKTTWWRQPASQPHQVITYNQKGILILSKMSIVKQDEFLEAAKGGSFGYTFYYLYRTIRQVAEGSVKLETIFTWGNVLWILILLSIISSIYALRRIYVAKSMLRVVPIPKKTLFSACASLALKPVFLTQSILLTTAYLLHSGNDFSAFFKTAHPVEMIVHGLLLISMPVAIYLLSFTFYASKDRGMIGFTLFILVLLGGYSLLFAGSVLGDVLPSKVIFLLLISTIPYVTAYFSLKKLVNVHS